MKGILALIKKEVQLDYKDGRAWASILLFVLSTDYVMYLAFREVLEVEVWNALLWTIILFAAFQVVSRSYDQDSGPREAYLFHLAGPRQVFVAKAIYSVLFLWSVGLLAYLVYAFFLPFPMAAGYDIAQFILGLLLGTAGLAMTLALVAAIAWKTGGGPGMVAILGLPIIVPLLLAILRYSMGVLNGSDWAFLQTPALSLLLLILIGGGLGYMLFPYIWRD